MQHPRLLKASRAIFTAAAFLCLGFLAGCDEHVAITRDPDVRIAKHATWAWRPATEPARARDSRPVVSRDVISRNNDTVARDTDANNEMVRQRVKTAIERTLSSKGLRQVSDPQEADFLVDYHFAVERHNMTVRTVYPGGYPGVVCGPFGCWDSWGWGPGAVGYEHIRFRAGTIVFDFIQPSSRHAVYRAVGEKEVHHDRFSLTQDEINGLVHHLLKDLHTR